MVARGPGAVGCAHCTQLGADVSCQVCSRLVCARCEADWATCAEPSGRVFRLGMGARLSDVDPGGRRGLVTTWHGTRKLIDLQRLSWLRSLLPNAWSFQAGLSPRLTAGHMIYARYLGQDGASLSGEQVDILYASDLTTGAETRISDVAPGSVGMVSAHRDRFAYVSTAQTVVVLDMSADRGPERRFDPLPRKVIHAVHLDAERNLLASGSWSEVVLHRIDGDRIELVARGETHGNVSFVAVAGPWLVAAARADGVTRLTAWALDAEGRITEESWRLEDRRPLARAAVSSDGRDLAFSFGTEVIVRDLASGTAMSFTEHTDGVNLIKFAGDHQLLITADADNRVVQRPRASTGYARALRKLALTAAD